MWETFRPASALLLAALMAILPGTHAQETLAVAAKMRAAAEALLASVDERKRARLALPFTDAARTDWHYTAIARWSTSPSSSWC